MITVKNDVPEHECNSNHHPKTQSELFKWCYDQCHHSVYCIHSSTHDVGS